MIVFGPGETKTAHQANEYIEVEAMIESAKIIALFVMDWCGLHTDGRMRMLKSIKSNGVTAVLDHDDFNKRIRVVRYDGAIEKAPPDIVATAKVEDAEKIIVYTKQHDEAVLAKHLFVPEGFLKGYYLGHPACLMVRYLTEKRRQTDSYIEEQETIEALYRTAPHHRAETTPVLR